MSRRNSTTTTTALVTGTAPQDVLRRMSRLVTATTVLGGAVALVLSAHVRIPVPGSVVPATLQTFVVLLLAGLLGPRLGTTSVLLYLAWGVAGIPVFSGGGGLAYLVQPTGGYLLGFVMAPALIGIIMGGRGRSTSLRRRLVAYAAASLVVLGLGALGLGWSLGLGVGAALAAGVVPFLAVEGVKVVLAALLGARFPSRERLPEAK